MPTGLTYANAITCCYAIKIQPTRNYFFTVAKVITLCRQFSIPKHNRYEHQH